MSVAVAAVVGVRRVYLGVHWPTDVLAAAAAYALEWQAFALPQSVDRHYSFEACAVLLEVPRTPDTSSCSAATCGAFVCSGPDA